MKYRLHSDTPVTWVGESRVRVGGIVRSVTVPDCALTHDLINELRKGATAAFLTSVAAAHPDFTESHANLLTELLTVCDPVPSRSTRRAKVVVRTPRSAAEFARCVAAEFARAGHAVTLAESDYVPPPSTRLVVEVTERVLTPRRYLPLMSNDQAHLVITRDLDGMLLGPLVIPGQSPCVRCDDLHRMSADASWLATATQLADLPAPNPQRELEWVTAMLAAISVEQFLCGIVPLLGESLTGVREQITRTGRERFPVEFQLSCGCQTTLGNAGLAEAQPTVASSHSNRKRPK